MSRLNLPHQADLASRNFCRRECTSAGIKDFKYQDVMKYPNNTSFALLAVNKQTGAVVAEVGQETTLVVKAGETLIFILNDVPGCYCDNTSAITVNWSRSV
jgi:NAD(P)H-nitrite reductase large subunit